LCIPLVSQDGFHFEKSKAYWVYCFWFVDAFPTTEEHGVNSGL